MLNTYYTMGTGKSHNKKILTDEGRKVLLNDYALGYSQKKIAKKMNASEDTIREWMKEEKIPTRKRKYSLNESYFKEIHTPEQAYWLGFLSADGYISEERGSIVLELQEQDLNHLQNFAKTLNSNRPLLTINASLNNKNFIHYRCVLNSRKMVNDLLLYGLHQNKSLDFEPKNIPLELFGFWIIGYLDGDGSIFKDKERVGIHFTGTQKTLSIIKEFLQSKNKISLEHRCQNTYKFRPEKDICENFLNQYHYDRLPFVLKRKQKHYSSLI